MIRPVPRGRAVYALEPANADGVEAMLFADGGSRGNPGPAASGAVLLDPAGEVIEEIGAYLGRRDEQRGRMDRARAWVSRRPSGAAFAGSASASIPSWSSSSSAASTA